jgi:hypothetical protein
LYREATTVLDALEGRGPSLHRCELRLGLADALSRAGSGRESRAVVLEAAEMARALDAAELLGRAALVLAGRRTPTTAGRTSRTLAALLDEAIDRLRSPAADGLSSSTEAIRAELLVRLAMELQFDASSSARCVQLLHEAEQVTEPLGDARLRLLVRWASIGTLHDPRAIVAGAEEVGRRAAAIGSLELALLSAIARVGYRTQSGDADGAAHEMVAFDHLLGDLDLPQYRWWAGLWLGSRALLEGRAADAALAIAASGSDEGIAAQGIGAIVQLWFQRVSLAVLTGDPFEPLVDEFDQFNVHSSDAARQDPLGVWLRWRAGRADEVRADVDGMLADGFGATRDGNWLLFTGLLGDAVAGMGHIAGAAPLYEQLRPFSGCLLSLGFGATPFGSVDHVLGRLASVTGDRARADAHLRQALGSLERCGARPWADAVAADLAALEV